MIMNAPFDQSRAKRCFRTLQGIERGLPRLMAREIDKVAVSKCNKVAFDLYCEGRLASVLLSLIHI